MTRDWRTTPRAHRASGSSSISDQGELQTGLSHSSPVHKDVGADADGSVAYGLRSSPSAAVLDLPIQAVISKTGPLGR